MSQWSTQNKEKQQRPRHTLSTQRLVENPSTTDELFLGKSVFFSDANNGTITSSGTMLRTTDAGLSWVYQMVDCQWINDACFTDANNGTVVGTDGKIYKTTNGGANWVLQTSGSASLYGVSFTDPINGTSVGASGTILRTENGGLSWNPKTSNTTVTLYDVDFINYSIGTVVGASGKILRTTDGGNNWISQASGVTVNFYSVSFINANTGTVVGANGTILKTTNGGTNWTAQTSGTTNSLSSVFFVDVNTGTVSGASGTILRTTNGGVNWTAQTSGTTTALNSIFFSDANNGMAVSGGMYEYGVILKTTNGGVNWNRLIHWSSQTSGITNDMWAVKFIDANTGTAVGEGGTILRTTNKGVNWASQNSGVTSFLSGVSFVNANTGTVVGYNNTILRTTNGGVNWIQQSTGGVTCDFDCVCFADANTGYATGYYAVILKTTNGGTNWFSQSNTGHDDLWSVSFINANTGIVTGEQGQIYHTTNGGNSWITQQSSGYGLYSACLIDVNTGYAVGDATTIYKTTNGGSNWINITPNMTSGYYNGVSFVNANIGTAVGKSSRAWNTTNGGLTWNPQFDSSQLVDFNAISLTDANNGTIVGVGGNILRLNNLTPVPSAPILISPANGALNQSLIPVMKWSGISNATSYRLQVSVDSTFASTTLDSAGITKDSLIVPSGKLTNGTKYYWRVNVVNAGGTSGWSSIFKFTTIVSVPSIPTLISPTNGATNQSSTPKMKWSNVSAMSYRLQVSTDSAFANTAFDSTGITVDSINIPSGKLTNNTKYYWRVNATNSAGTSSWSTKFNFTVSATGIGSIASELPKVYMLYNNYPNPFNPTTKIKFDIPTNGFTKIAIFDMLGREIKTLVNENLTAGTYEMEWNATSYASGIYFYKMISGNYISIKKMALIK